MFKAICIKGYDGMYPGEIVKAKKAFNGNMRYSKGFRMGKTIPQYIFDEYFVPFNYYYVVEKPLKKRYFRRPKRQFARVEFRGIDETALIKLYNCVFSYIEMVKQKNPELIQTFNYSIVTTLEKLEYLYKVLPPAEFLLAIADSEQVFKGVYKTALSIELETLPRKNDYQQLLDQFKIDNSILGEFFNELNKR